MNGRESTSTATPSSATSETGIPNISGRVTPDKINEAFLESDKRHTNHAVEIFEALNSKFLKLEKAQAKVDKNQRHQVDVLQNQIKKLANESKDSTFRMIEVVGIYTALLGFIVFEAQIFKATQSTLTLIGLTSIMLGALVTFVLLLDLAFDGFKTNRNLRWGLFLGATACIGAGFIAASVGYKNGDYNLYLTEEEVIAEIDKRINNSQNATTTIIKKDDTELLEFKNCILKNGLARCL